VVNLTERALFFHEGEIVMEGSPKAVTAEYQRFCHVSKSQAAAIIAGLKASAKAPTREAESLPKKPEEATPPTVGR
jgi:hypothetical protein